MNEMVIFEVRGPLGHFRRPDTLVTHSTYPFIPRTALHGLIASVLGLDKFPDPPEALPDQRPWCALRILRPVRTTAHQMSYHGKGWTGDQSGATFNRPTTVELVVNPHYRVWYAGPGAAEFADRLRQRRSMFHTYLGSAFCLTFPELRALLPPNAVRWLQPEPREEFVCSCIVPAGAVHAVVPEPGSAYARAGGFMQRSRGGRRFEGTLSFIYDPRGGRVRFRCAPPNPNVRFARVPAAAGEHTEGLVFW